MLSRLPKSEVVLLGIGHTNAHVLRRWRMSPLPDARLTCISNFSTATYSGMLPGALAGLYEPERMSIDLVRLCAAAGARLIVGDATGLDLDRREVVFGDRTPVPFDVLSIGVGSQPRLDGVNYDAELLLAIKPMQTFLSRLELRLREWQARRSAGDSAPLRAAIVGAGAGGVEITFCLPPFVRAIAGVDCELHLVDGHERVLKGAAPSVVRRVERELAARNVTTWLGRRVQRVASGQIEFNDGAALDVDVALWATSAVAPPILARLGLPTNADGFLLTRPTLQSIADAPIFAVGDSGFCENTPVPRAGVYAVRQGPILWENLARSLRGEPLTEYRPQQGFLSLLATGDRRAILGYKGRSAHAGWCWKLKNRIDSRFMAMYQDYTPMPSASMANAAASDSQGTGRHVMRCTGCGGKIGADVLGRVLARLDIPSSPNVLTGLDRPDDAALYRCDEGRPVLATVDFFAAFHDDPYLVGRVAALNALSDVFACRGTPKAALAIATIPIGPPRRQEQLLYELLAGALHEFRACGATLMGGHTIEGPQTTIGFTVLGDVRPEAAGWKSGLRDGDALVLTKPLGTGMLLAAHGQAACRAAWMDTLIPMLTTGNRIAASLAETFDVGGLTDVTGFGLAGHLLEMLDASAVGATIDLDRVPLLPGVCETYANGVESTLAPANRQVAARLTGWQPPPGGRREARDAIMLAKYAALFDPQTSGGLLLGVAPGEAQRLVEQISTATGQPAAIIGQATRRMDADRPLSVS